METIQNAAAAAQVADHLIIYEAMFAEVRMRIFASIYAPTRSSFLLAMEGFVSDSDIPIQHEGSEDEGGEGDAPRSAVREDGRLDPVRVREDLLDFLDELSAAEDTGSEEEEGEGRRSKYQHLPWRGRCWRVSSVLPRPSLSWLTCSYPFSRESSSVFLEKQVAEQQKTLADTDSTTL